MSLATTQNVYGRLILKGLWPATGRSSQRDLLWPLAIFVSLIVAWEVLVHVFEIRPIILPGPIEIVDYTITRHELFINHLWPTLIQTVLGFLLAVVGGVILGVLVYASEIGRRGVMPLLVIAQIVPKIAVAPLLMLWFGLGGTSRVLIAFLIAFFPMVINTVSGLANLSEDVVRLGRALTPSRTKFFFRIQLPHALPYIFDGMKVSITLAVIGIIVAEFVSSQKGLGYLIIFANGNLDTVMMMASITVLSLAGLLLYGIIALLARCIVYWGHDTAF